jgi:hypothetical protein
VNAKAAIATACFFGMLFLVPIATAVGDLPVPMRAAAAVSLVLLGTLTLCTLTFRPLLRRFVETSDRYGSQYIDINMLYLPFLFMGIFVDEAVRLITREKVEVGPLIGIFAFCVAFLAFLKMSPYLRQMEVSVTSKPLGAVVRINEKKVGKTPLKLKLACGETLRVAAEKEGYIDYKGTLQVKASKPTFEFELLESLAPKKP